MSALQITLSGPTKSFVEARAAEAGCSPDDLVETILNGFEKMAQKRKLNEMLMAGYRQLRKGLGRVMTDADWQRLEANIDRKFKRAKK